ncbi:MAG: ABC transporter permease [Promethearchaeota archaeon]
MQLELLGANLAVVIIPVVIIVAAFLLWKERRLIKLAIRNLGRRKTRNILTVLGVTLSISLYVAFNISADNALQSFFNVIEISGGKVDFEITRLDGEPFDQDILEDILKVEGVQSAAPRMQRYCIIWVNADGNSTAAQVIGIDPKYDNAFGDLLDYQTGEPVNDLLKKRVAIVSELLMEGITWEQGEDDDVRLVNATVGDSLKIKYRSSGNRVRTRIFDIVAFAEATGKVREIGYGASLFIPLREAQALFRAGGEIDKIIVEMDKAYSDVWEDVQKRLEDVVKDEGLTVYAPKQSQLESARSGVEGMRSGLFFAGMTSLLAMVFLIFNAINMTIAERKYEIGVLRSIGFKKHHIFRLFLYEVIIIGLIGSAIGVFAGIGLSRVLYLYVRQLFFLEAETLVGAEFEALPPVNPAHLQNGFIIGVIFTVVGGLYPLLSITGLKIIYALRAEARITEKHELKRRIAWIAGGIGLIIGGIGLFFALLMFPQINFSLGEYVGSILDGTALLMIGIGVTLFAGALKRKYLIIYAGIALLAVGVYDTFYVGSFIGSFVLMGGSIIFTAGILNGVGGFFNFILKRIPGLRYVSNLATKNIARKPTRSTLTFGIFTIALAMVIIMAAITSSIGNGIINWVDSNIEADMFVVSNTGAPPNLSGNITRNIEGIHWENTSEGWIPSCTIQEFAGAEFELWSEDFDSLLLGVNSSNYAVVNENTQITAPNDTDVYTLFKQLKNPNANNCILSDKLANELEVTVGQKTPITINSHFNSTEFKVIGIIHNDMFGYPGAGYFGMIDIDKLYDFGFEKKAHMFTIRLDNYYLNGTEVDAQVVADQIDAIWGDEYKLGFTIKEDIKEDIDEQVQEIGTFFAIISYASIIVGLLALVTTMIKIVSERRREIGLLRTIGIKRSKVMQLILFESIFLGMIGLILGIIDGYILGLSIVTFIGQAGGTPFQWEFVMPWLTVAQTTIVAVIVAIVGAIFPAWQSGRIAPAESLRYTG